MKKTILTSVIAIAFAMPAIAANIPNNATCNSGVLGVSSGSANLEADYTANTINITWDGNGGSTPTGGASSCTYDKTFNLPAAPTKTGYTFAGWAVQAAQSCFANYTDDDNDWAAGSYTNTTGQNATWTATSVSGNVATGISKCSSTEGSYNTAGTPSDENGKYCWCQVSTYTPNGGTLCNVASPAWVYNTIYEDAEDCASRCAPLSCAWLSASMRCPLFGLSGEQCDMSGSTND